MIFLKNLQIPTDEFLMITTVDWSTPGNFFSSSLNQSLFFRMTFPLDANDTARLRNQLRIHTREREKKEEKERAN